MISEQNPGSIKTRAANRRRGVRIFFTALMLASGLVSASAFAGNVGVRLYNDACAACHGNRGEGNQALRAPALAGLDEAYLRRQLQHFRDGVRGVHPDDKDGAVMRTAVATVSGDAAMREVIVAITALPVPQPVAAPTGADLTAGRNYYNGICSACHGGKAEGNLALNSPRLSVQNADYLVRQFSHFRTQIRGGHANDKYGRQMAKITKAIVDDKLAADIAAYIVQLGRTP